MAFILTIVGKPTVLSAQSANKVGILDTRLLELLPEVCAPASLILR